MARGNIVIVGGGAAGFFAAITCAEATSGHRVIVLEKGAEFLSKVRISGGGRCNVTHACFDPRQLSGYYPRGGTALLGPFHRFQPSDTIAWFESRGVQLKTEPDGRVFPTSDSSHTIIDCLLGVARAVGVDLLANTGAERITVEKATGEFEVTLSTGGALNCARLMLATGGCRTASAAHLATSLGHALEPPVPSLFAFHLNVPWLRDLAGVSVDSVEVAVPSLGLRERGPILVTHAGLSGPVILRLSAWGARGFHQRDYRFPLRVDWLPEGGSERALGFFRSARAKRPARFVANTSLPSLPARLWEQLVAAVGISPQTRWADLSRSAQHRLAQQLTSTELQVIGKSLNKEEFVTCGGVSLGEVNFRTMESRICPGLYFGGELLDIDGLTGGFNFQAAWTTGWIAGRGMSRG